MRLIPPEELGMNLYKIIVIYFLFLISIYSQDTYERYTVMGEVLLSQSTLSKSNSTEFSAEDIEKLPNSHLQDIVGFTPGMTFTGGSSKGRFFQIRGIGERSSYEGMPNYSVALVLDDIDYSGMGDIMNLSDVETVSIQKGPQLTVQGPNGIGGLIALKTKESTLETSAEGSIGYGNYNTQNLYTSVSGLVFDRMSYRLSTQLFESDGHIKNTFKDNEDTNYSDNKSVKARLNYQDALWDIKLNIHHFNFDEGYDVFNQSNSRTTFSDHPGHDRNEVNAQSLKVEREFGNILSSTTLSYLKSNSEYSYDEDWGNNQYWNNLAGWNTNYNYEIRFPKQRERKSLDQRFYFQNNNLTSHIGLYLRKDEEITTEWGFKNEAQRKKIKADLEIEQIALYGQTALALTNNSEFVFGIRLENRSSQYLDTQQVVAKPDELLWGAEVSYVVRPVRGMRTYLKLARGFKGGGINTQSSIEQNRKEFTDEKLYLIEGGWDYRYSAGDYVKGSAYVMFRDDVQVKTSYQDDPTDPSSYVFYQDNASSAKVLGLEVEGRHSLNEVFFIKYGASFMKSSFGSYRYGARDLKNRELAYSPEYQFNISLDYKNRAGFFASILSSLQDNLYFGNSHDQKSKVNQLVHLNIGKEFRWGNISLWAQNIFNERTELRGFYFSNEPPNWNEARYVQLGPPRTYGVKANFNF